MSSLIGNVPREKLKELIEKHGDTLLQDPGRCEGLLKDHCGAYRKEISALMGALDERIPLEAGSPRRRTWCALRSAWMVSLRLRIFCSPPRCAICRRRRRRIRTMPKAGR